jgi:hypothetical protein
MSWGAGRVRSVEWITEKITGSFQVSWLLWRSLNEEPHNNSNYLGREFPARPEQDISLSEKFPATSVSTRSQHICGFASKRRQAYDV